MTSSSASTDGGGVQPVAVVTGASRGIGRATALALADAGCAVAAVARTPAGVEGTRELIESRGGRCVGVVADVTDTSAAHDVAAQIEEQVGPITVLVNNAGSLLAIGPVWDVSPEDWWADIRSSLGGAFVWCQEVVPLMMARGEGRIVNVTSYAACRPAPFQVAYACAKAALISLTEALAASLDESGLKAFAVAPGFTDTEMTRHLRESVEGKTWLPNVGAGRVSDAEDTAALIALLASGAADALNGRVLHTLDDVRDLLSRIDEIRRDDLYVPRLRRLDG
jgi:NAD(P)-dependent dehydrogenase (short-subunit alcohol dehydrogenase family)